MPINKSQRESNFEVILLHYQSEEGEVPLTPKQQELKTRWEYADEIIRRNEVNRDTLTKMIMRRFNVSRTTAFQDIMDAERLHASSTPLNKKYRIGLRIEQAERKIEELYEDGDNVAAVMLEKVLATYYKEYPEDAPKKSPKVFVFKIDGNVLPPALPVDDALDRARALLQKVPRIIDITPKPNEDDEPGDNGARER